MKLSLEQIKTITQGAVRIIEDGEYIRFYRFSKNQEDMYNESGNHGFYLKSFSTAGVKLEFKTDSTKLYMKVYIEYASTRKYFSHDIFVNGKMIGSIDNFSDVELPERYTGVDLPAGEFSKEFALGDGEKTVCIYFPWTVTSKLMELTLDDGSSVIPVKKEKKIITFGDSITHGYDALRPSNRYAGRLAEAIDAEEINKAIGGEVFCPELAQAKDDFEPDYITVAYGTNDWNRRTADEFRPSCREFYKALSKNYPNAKIFAITPIWRKDCTQERAFGDFADVEKIIRECTYDLLNVECISGFGFVPHEEKYYADFRLHPNDAGFDFYFNNLCEEIKKRI